MTDLLDRFPLVWCDTCEKVQPMTPFLCRDFDCLAPNLNGNKGRNWRPNGIRFFQAAAFIADAQLMSDAGFRLLAHVRDDELYVHRRLEGR